ncbi:hypothetical protein SYNPS1DRAFT_27881 [Syncephalis pseudoplumigaleata]|uniref:Uncharacterized protein n=1 Tax=Syncephalis pseudoplumigaleata TaxID=1712513 RepID=A0A4P9Z1U5_9FUNG|nr:hypothetical protein SYNPS1DRAFT_27881 [Syncephalis pseudoplumigaleata]|eukprot:RKP26424.1 hypothetical protein SYNPS1DRAFT_27881 [Syncephalis pseudoplumigaleata]
MNTMLPLSATPSSIRVACVHPPSRTLRRRTRARWLPLIIVLLQQPWPAVQAVCGDGRGCLLASLPISTAIIILSSALLISAMVLVMLVRHVRTARRHATRRRCVSIRPRCANGEPCRHHNAQCDKPNDPRHTPPPSPSSQWRWRFRFFSWLDNSGGRRQSRVACEKVELDQVITAMPSASKYSCATPAQSSANHHNNNSNNNSHNGHSRWHRMFCEITERPPSPPPPPPPSPVRLRSTRRWLLDSVLPASPYHPACTTGWPTMLPVCYSLEAALPARPPLALIAESHDDDGEASDSTMAVKTAMAEDTAAPWPSPPKRPLARAATWSPTRTTTAIALEHASAAAPLKAHTNASHDSSSSSNSNAETDGIAAKLAKAPWIATCPQAIEQSSMVADTLARSLTMTTPITTAAAAADAQADMIEHKLADQPQCIQSMA